MMTNNYVKVMFIIRMGSLVIAAAYPDSECKYISCDLKFKLV